MTSMSSLSLIQIINLLHSTEGENGEMVPETICQAKLFVQKILARGLDHLSSDARILFLLLEKQVTDAYCRCQNAERCKVRLNRTALRKETGWSDTRLKTNLEELLNAKYVRLHRKKTASSYELLYDSAKSRCSHYVMKRTGPCKIS